MFGRGVRLVVALTLFVGLGATASPEANAGSGASGTITVSAAASLRESFTELGKAFRSAHPQARVRFNFGSSSVLVSQVLSGAPADVVALADLATMDKLVSAGIVSSAPRVFARNSMAIAVKKGNPLKVVGLSDLARVGVVSMCVQTAPCGSYAKSVLARVGVSIPESKITRGVDASATLAQVVTGDAQAAIVYVTDVRSAGKSVDGIAIPRSVNVTAMYPIATVKGSRQQQTARAFVDFVSSDAGQSILKKFGFARP